MPSMCIAVVHGPNLNLLGSREPEVYGHTTLQDIEREVEQTCLEAGVQVRFFQSNHEGALIDFIQNCKGQVQGLVVNAGGLTHSSVSLRDALVAVQIPFVEVHISNVYAREGFRHTSLLSDVSQGVVVGLGPVGYVLAVRGLLRKLAVL
jgi:3-dehydroquinate dehydratase-2